MTDERLRLAVPDDQVCEVCQAIVMSQEAHAAWHRNITDFIQQRTHGLEKRLRAYAEQAADLIGVEQHDRDTAVGGLQASINRIEARLPDMTDTEYSERVNLLMSVPELRVEFDDEESDGEAKPKEADALPLPPDKWDKYGVQWSAFWNDKGLYWEADTQAGRLALRHKDPHLADRGPFTETSPLAEDQEPDPDEESDGDRLARMGTDATKWADRFVALFQGMMVGRANQVDEDLMIGWFAGAIETGRLAGTSEAYAKNPARPDDPQADPSWVDQVTVPLWQPSFAPDEKPNLASAVYQAVGAGSMCWENVRDAGRYQSEQAAWVGTGLLAWLEAWMGDQ